MTNSSNSLILLDVGHGNCSLLDVVDGTVVIDVANYGILADYLDSNSIEKIDHLVLSHADADHIAGASALITDDRVSVVHANPDSTKLTKTWKEFRMALWAGMKLGNVKYQPLIANTEPFIQLGGSDLRLLSPGVVEFLGGAGGVDGKGRPLDSNSMSAVVLISVGGDPFTLLPGDINADRWEHMLSDGSDPNASILVFPHHGGRASNGNDVDFAKSVTETVKPDVIVFSIGRSRYKMPRPEIIAGIRSASKSVRIACTQLSENCAAVIPVISQGHLSPIAALGKSSGVCCAGTMKFSIFANAATAGDPELYGHKSYVTQLPSPLCL